MAILDTFVKRLRYRKVLPLIPPDPPLKILDAGSGDGGFAKILREMGHDVITADKEGGDVTCDFEKPLPFKDKEFDIAVSLAVAEHLRNPFLFLEELKRVAHTVIITTPSPLAKPVLECLAFANLINREHIRDHKVYLSKEDLERLGFRHKYFLFGLNQLCVYP